MKSEEWNHWIQSVSVDLIKPWKYTVLNLNSHAAVYSQFFWCIRGRRYCTSLINHYGRYNKSLRRKVPQQTNRKQWHGKAQYRWHADLLYWETDLNSWSKTCQIWHQSILLVVPMHYGLSAWNSWTHFSTFILSSVSLITIISSQMEPQSIRYSFFFGLKWSL